MDDKDVFLHNYSQLASMLSEYISAMSAVNQLSLQYLTENQMVLRAIVDSSYYAYSSMNSLVKALAATGDEKAKEVLVDSKEFSDKVEKGWHVLKDRFSGSIPNLDHPLLGLSFIVAEEEEDGEGKE